MKVMKYFAPPMEQVLKGPQMSECTSSRVLDGRKVASLGSLVRACLPSWQPVHICFGVRN